MDTFKIIVGCGLMALPFWAAICVSTCDTREELLGLHVIAAVVLLCVGGGSCLLASV